MPGLRRAVLGGEGPAAETGSRTCRRRVRPWSCGGASAGWCAASRCVGDGRSPRLLRRSGRGAGSPSGSGTRWRPRSRAATGPCRDVAAEYGVSWPTAHKALVAAAARWLPEPEPTAVLGIDETRFRSVRWILDGITWKRSDPWLTSFVDCTPGRPGRCSAWRRAAPAAVCETGSASSPRRSGGGSRSW